MFKDTEKNIKKTFYMFEDLTLIRNGGNLDDNDAKRVLGFIITLLNFESSKRIKVVFRGDKFATLKKVFNIDEYRLLPEFAFMLGNKGKYYWKGHIKERKAKDTFEIDNVEIKFFAHF